jgi:hypothetical protein
VDVARMGFGAEFPEHTSTVGRHFMLDDDWQTPIKVNRASEIVLPNDERWVMELEVRRRSTYNDAGIGRENWWQVSGGCRPEQHDRQCLFAEIGYLATADEAPASYGAWLYK